MSSSSRVVRVVVPEDDVEGSGEEDGHDDERWWNVCEIVVSFTDAALEASTNVHRAWFIRDRENF